MVRVSDLSDHLSLGQVARVSCPLSLGLWGARVGEHHKSLSVRSCELTFGAAQAEGGHREGVASCLREGCPGLGTFPPLIARPSGRRPGTAAGFRSVRGVRLWGPATNPTARALVSWRCPLWGRQEGIWGGGGHLVPL